MSGATRVRGIAIVVRSLASVVAAGLLLVFMLAGGSLAAQPPTTTPPTTTPPTTTTGIPLPARLEPGPISSDAAQRRTRLAVPVELESLVRTGGVPDSLAELRMLERQQQRVAEAATECTVGVKIGPAQGCGAIVTDTGYVLTAAHVAMRPGKEAEILLANGRTVTGMTLGMNRNVDAGLIRINPGQNNGKPWPHASLGSSRTLEVGMWCIATGHPGGFDPQRGPVTRVGRVLKIKERAIVTDCALIGGDSGGPLFDLSGSLIAIHSRIGNDVDDNLHVPIDYYDDSWDRLSRSEAWGYLPGFKPVLGVTGRSELLEARIIEVKLGSPAETAGLRPDDVVTRFGEMSISDFDSLRSAVSDTMPGERVGVWLRRGGSQLKVVVEIGRADDAVE